MPVAEATLSAKPSSYAAVLELDKKIRQMAFPASLNFGPHVKLDEKEFCSSSLSIRGLYASQYRTVS